MFLKKFASLLIVLFTIAIIGCSENPTIVNDNNKQIPTSIQQPCGTPVNYNFFINKTTLAGIITVSNDETNLFITYTLNSPYLIPPGGAHVWLGSTAPTGKGAPGQYPYHSDNTTYVSTYTFTIPLTDLQQYMVNGTFYFMTHAAVVVQNQDGSYGSEATGYSEHIVIPQRGAWYGYNSYTWQECGGGGGEGNPDEWYVCQTETAWGGHLAYPGSNWSLYIEYSGGTVTENLWAGQFTNIGSVTVTTNSGGFVVISYNVTLPDWSIYVYHTGVYSTVSGIPHSPGGIIPGQLAYSQSYYNTSINPPIYVKADEQTSVSVTTTYQYTSGTVYVAAHAGVHKWCLVQ